MIVTNDHGPIRELRLNRPPVNALNTELMIALRQGIERASREGVRAVVLSGSLGMFSAGLDIPLLLSLDRRGMEQLWQEFYALLEAIARSPIPVAAALTGHAPAGGTVISIFCDWRAAARGDFKLGLSEVQVGITMPPVVFEALRRQVGPRQAERLAVGGLIVSSEEAFCIGLVDELAAPEEVVELSLEWCRSLLTLPPDAMSNTRRLARADLAGLFHEKSEQELGGVLDSWFSAETQETLKLMVKRLGKKAS